MELLNDKLRKGYLIGPFNEHPFEVYRIHPISVAQKKYSDKKRLVVDLSAPHNDSENCWISRAYLGKWGMILIFSIYLSPPPTDYTR